MELNSSKVETFVENLLNPPNMQIIEDDTNEISPYIPVLDDTFTDGELDEAVGSLKINKSYSGICPGITKSLPVSWFFFILASI